MILDRLLCAVLALLALATIAACIFLTFTGIPALLGFATVAVAGLLWLVRRTIRASVAASHRTNGS